MSEGSKTTPILFFLCLPVEVYLTLYVRLVSIGSRRNSRDAAEGMAIGLITLTNLFFVFILLQTFMGTIVFLGKVGVAAIFFGFFILNFLALSKMRYGNAFESKLASMSVAKQRFLDVLAVGWVIFVFALLFWTAPPLPLGSP